MPRIVINGREVRNPLARFVALVVACVLAAVALASAAAWGLLLLGLGAAIVLAASVLVLLLAAVAVPWAIVSALFGDRRPRR